MDQILTLFLIVLMVYGISKINTFSLFGGNIPVSNVISHWSHSFRSFALSSDSFYQDLETMITSHEMPHSIIKRITHKEAGFLSAARIYLRIQHGDIVFDVCAAPFGKDFFISWWLYETDSGMRRLFKSTKLGDFLRARAERRTFYQIDEEAMFRSCVHECILETIEKSGRKQGYRQLTDTEKAFTMGGV